MAFHMSAAPSQSAAPGQAGRPRRPFKWTRRLLLALAFLVLLAAILPPLTSGPRLAGLIADVVSNNADLPVAISNSNWSWWGGLELRDFRTHLNDQTQLVIERVSIRTGLWDLLQGRNLRDVQIDGMTVNLTLGQPLVADRQVAPEVALSPPASLPSPDPASSPASRHEVLPPTSPVAPLVAYPPAPQSPSPATRAARLMKRNPRQKSGIDAIPVNKVVLSRCLLNIHDESTGRSARIFLPALQIDLDRKTGGLTWQLSAKLDEFGLLTSQGSFILPRLAIEPTDLGGRLQVAWSDLPLVLLPTSLRDRMNLASLDGKSGGQLHLQLGKDWVLSWDAAVSAQDLTMCDTAGRKGRLSHAAAGFAGRWHMIDQQLEIADAWAQLPGATLKASGPAVVYDGRTNQILRSSLVGTIEDARLLRVTLEDLGVRLPESLELAGQASLDAQIDRQADSSRVEVGLQGEKLSLFWPGVFSRKSNSPLALRAVCRLGDDGSLLLESSHVQLPGGVLTASAELASMPNKAIRAVTLRRSQVQLRWDNFEALMAQLPSAAIHLAEIGSFRGPGTLDLWANQDAREGLSAGASLTLPEAAEVSLEDWLNKPAGQDLRLDVLCALNANYDTLTVDHVALESARQPIVRIENVKVQASKQMHSDSQGQQPILLVDLNATLGSLDLSALQELSSRLADGVRQAGHAAGIVQGRLAASCWADISTGRLQLKGLDAVGELNLDGIALRLENAIRKARGEELRLATSYSYHWDGTRSYGYGSGSIQTDGFAAQGWYERSPLASGPMQWAWGWLDVRNIGRTAEMFPTLADAVRKDNIAGQLAGHWEWFRQSESFDLHTVFDLTGVQVQRIDAGIDKPSGLPAKIDLVVSGPAGKDAGQRWRLPKAEFTLGQSHAGITDGEIEISEPWARLLAGQDREAWGAIQFTWPIRHARAQVSGVTVFGETAVSKDLTTLLAPYRAAGPVQWTLDWTYELGKGINFLANLEAQELALAAGPLDKPGGVPLRTDIQGNVQTFRDGRNVPHVRLTVADASCQISNLEWKGQAEVVGELTAGDVQLVSAKVAGSGQSQQLGELVSLVPPAKPWQLRGHVAWDGTCTFDREKGWRLEDLDVGFWPVEGELWDVPLRVEGLLNFQQDEVATTGLAAKVGSTEGRFTFHAVRDGNVLVNQFGAAFAMIDVDELVGLYKKASEEFAKPISSQPVTTQGASAPPIDLARSVSDFSGQTDGLRFTMKPGRDPVRMRLLSWDGSLTSGNLNVELVGAFEGGSLTAQVTGKLDGKTPLKIHYRAERSQPTPLTQWVVVRSFPGMRVDGPVTLDETLIIDPNSKAPAIPSSGEMIVEGGEVSGAAAPRSIQRLFPKLELAKFRFSRLHNWFEKDAQGKTVNRMIYRGSPWSMYMNGWSQADGTFRYEIGVDMLGPIESEYWATADRGRVPLFIKTGQVIDGKIRDEVIRYLYPQQILGRILKDNLLTITYYAVRQRVVGGRPPAPRPVPAPATQPK